jgi:heat shock protein 1/8
VPAYFNDSQRQATQDAGLISGLSVLRIINEPTAAAISYGLGTASDDDGEKRVLIFDLGGGTFDVSLLSIEDGIFEVKATAGDTHLGGEDFDHRIMDYVVGEFKKKHKMDPSKNERALRRLRTACEKAKRILSSQTTTTIEVESFMDGTDLTVQLSRARFENLCGDYFRNTIDPVKLVLKDSGIDKNTVSEVVLVGGSSRIPKIQELLSRFFDGKELNKSVNPDEAVAAGAAVQAAILTDRTEGMDTEILLVDVTPLSLGVEAAGGLMSVLIPRNNTIPCKKHQIFTTHEDNQTAVHIQVFEGERAQTADNHRLGKFDLLNIPKAPRGVPKIKVTFDLDSNGILNVSALETASGTTSNIVIKNDTGRLTQSEIESMVADAEKHKAVDEQHEGKLKARYALSSYAGNVALNLKNADFKEKVDVADQGVLSDAVANAEQWLIANDEADHKDLLAQLEKFQSAVDPILKKAASAYKKEDN